MPSGSAEKSTLLRPYRALRRFFGFILSRFPAGENGESRDKNPKIRHKKTAEWKIDNQGRE